jgi:transcription antitermination factor NusG
MQTLWYVLRSKPRKEAALFAHASSLGFEVFFPRVPVKRVNPRARTIVPFFPGYMFVHVNLAEVGTSTFEWMPHAIGLVSFGDEPAAVDPELIEEIRSRVRRIASAGGEVLLDLRRGDRVEITHGPFAGYEAIFDARLSGGGRVRVLLNMLSDRAVHLDLRVGGLQRLS